MTQPSPQHTTTAVGVISGAVGLALAMAPDRANAALGLTNTAAMRAIGLADVALAPKLLTGRRRWPWMLGRAALNLAIAAHLLASRSDSRIPVRPTGAAVALCALTVGDVKTAAQLRAAGS